MIGLVLAAGAGRRLRPYTEELPKALVPVRSDGTSVLDETLANFATAGLNRVVIVVGHRAEAIAARVSGWEATHRLAIELIHNDRAEDWNNAYSLWCARHVLQDGAILANGDTLHPSSVTLSMLEEPLGPVALAIDDRKALGDEEMKVCLDGGGNVRAISKQLPHDADGEYIGVARIGPTGAALLAGALERVWRADPSSFYEAAFQLLADEGHAVSTRPIGDVAWIEIDNLDDLARAQEIACLS